MEKCVTVVEIGMDYNKNKRVKEEAFSVAKLEQKVKENTVTTMQENATKMLVIHDELRASNTKTNAILEILCKIQSFALAP